MQTAEEHSDNPRTGVPGSPLLAAVEPLSAEEAVTVALRERDPQRTVGARCASGPGRIGQTASVSAESHYATLCVGWAKRPS